MQKSIDQKHLLMIITVFSALLIVMMGVCRYTQRLTILDISGLNGRLEKEGIVLSWSAPPSSKFEKIQIDIQSEEGTDIVMLDPASVSYTFDQGTHGVQYSFHVKMISDNGAAAAGDTISLLYVDWSQIPDLPLLTIETKNGETPQCNAVEAPKDAFGTTISGNEYVSAEITLKKGEETCVHAVGRIKIRGNTSALKAKKPYKLEFKKPIDLMNRGDPSYNSRYWYLLFAPHRMYTEVGLLVSRLLNVEYVPAIQPINVIMNGKWIGCYDLIESIEPGPRKISLSDSGFILEDNAYWWNEDEGNVLPQTEFLMPQMRYTYKYPAASQLSEQKKENIYRYMTGFESATYAVNKDNIQYIDEDSFAAWLLVHDIIGSTDSAGSNIFLYKYDLDPQNPTSSLLKIGPPWDFDGSMVDTDCLASIHRDRMLPINSLMQNEHFRSVYKQKWEECAPTLLDDIKTYLGDYIDTYGEAVNQSWRLDDACWAFYKKGQTVQGSVSTVVSWLEEHIKWLDSNMKSI